MQESAIKILESVTVSREQGGFREFEKRGEYPDFLVFKSTLLKKTWRQRLKSEKQIGLIKTKGRALFNYELTPSRFRLRYINSDGKQSKWVNKEIIFIIYD
jgi:hypothetical protein